MLEFLSRSAELLGHLLVVGTFLGSIWGVLWAVLKRPGKRISEALDKVDTMSKALGPNGGKSLADEIHKQGHELRRQGAVQMEQSVALTKTAVAMDSLTDMIEKAIFQTDAAGHWLRVNRTFSHTFGHAPQELLGMGWVTFIHTQDRDTFLQEWTYAIRDRRPVRREVRFIARSGRAIPSILHATPALGVPDVHLGWFGTVELVTTRGSIETEEEG